MNIRITASYFMLYIRSNEYGLAQALCELGHLMTILTSRSTREKIITAGASFALDFEVDYIPTFIFNPNSASF